VSHEAAAQKTLAISNAIINAIIIFHACWSVLWKTFFFHIHDALEVGVGGKDP